MRALYDRTEDVRAYVIEFILMISQKTNEEKDYCSLYLVRHGETEWNAKELVQGHTDIPLNKKGERQAKELARRLKHIHFAAAFSSDLLRARRTAEIIALEKKIAVKTTKALRERYFGRFEKTAVRQLDKSLEELMRKYGEEIEKEIESDEGMMKRLIPFIREIAVAYRHKNVLVVAHGGIMRTFLIHLGFASASEMPPGSIKNTAYVKLESDGVDFFIKETFGIERKK